MSAHDLSHAGVKRYVIQLTLCELRDANHVLNTHAGFVFTYIQIHAGFASDTRSLNCIWQRKQMMQVLLHCFVSMCMLQNLLPNPLICMIHELFCTWQIQIGFDIE